MSLDFAGVQRPDEVVRHKPTIVEKQFPHKPPKRPIWPYRPTKGFKKRKGERK